MTYIHTHLDELRRPDVKSEEPAWKFAHVLTDHPTGCYLSVFSSWAACVQMMSLHPDLAALLLKSPPTEPGDMYVGRWKIITVQL